MLTDDKMLELIEKLRNDFDVVVIDTPPVGYVADMFQLNEIIDANLFIVRHKYTFKQGLKTALKEVSTHHLKGVGIIVNDIKIGKNNYGFSGVYGYGYGYGYDYGNGTGKGKNNSKRKKLNKEEVT
jgi:Mrp family chromosome partitioning ATPase